MGEIGSRQLAPGRMPATSAARLNALRLHVGEIKDVSRFCTFGCKAWVHLNSERREKGKHTPRALEAMYLGFEHTEKLFI